MQMHWGSERQQELRYQVTYHTHLVSVGPLSCTPSIKLAVGRTICKVCFFVLNFFPFIDYVMLTWEQIPGSPRFSVLQATKSWRRPGNEGTGSWWWAIRIQLWLLLSALNSARLYHIISCGITIWYPIKQLEFHIIDNVYCYGPNKVTDVRTV